MRHASVEAAELPAGEGVSVEVIDRRTLVPFDYTAVFESIDRTHHLVVAQEASFGASWGATVVARSTQDRFDSFDAPPLVVGGDDTPIPYASVLERAWVPSAQRIADGVRQVLDY
jgi:pyruvate/2-oxoglutarate/acetoin dehydrogenase E1 component